MSNEGVWNQARVEQEAHAIENAARQGDSSKAFRDEDYRISQSSTNSEERRANAAAVTAQLEKDGFLPVCGFDLARASGQAYKAPECGEALANQSNMLTNSPSESIERAVYDKEGRLAAHGKDLQFGSARPLLPKEQEEQKSENKPKVKSEKEQLMEDNAKLLEQIKALQKLEAEAAKAKEAEAAKVREAEAAKVREAARVKEAEAAKAREAAEAARVKAETEAARAKETARFQEAAEAAKAKEAEQTTARSVLKDTISKIDLQSAVKSVNSGEEITRSVRVTTDKDGAIHIAGAPYGNIDLDAKASVKIEKDGSVTATDADGTSFHFLNRPDAKGLVLETKFVDGEIEKKYGPNNAKLISETITPKPDGQGYTSRKEYNRDETSEDDYKAGKMKNPLNTHRADWITSSTMEYDANNKIQTSTFNYGRSRYLDEGVRKSQEVFHYKDGKPVTTGAHSEIYYDNGYKYTELASGQTYLQIRNVSKDVDPIKFTQQSEKNALPNDQTMKNGSVWYAGKEWALSDKQLRPGVHIARVQRELPENYANPWAEGELKP